VYKQKAAEINEINYKASAGQQKNAYTIVRVHIHVYILIRLSNN